MFAALLSRLSPRALAGVAFVAIVGCAALTLAYFYARAVAEKAADLRQHVLVLAREAAASVDLDAHESLRQAEQLRSEAYQRALEPLVRFHRRHPNVLYVFTVRETPDQRQFFILETIQDPGIDRRQQQLGRRPAKVNLLEEYHVPPASRPGDTMLRTGRAYVFPIPYTDDYGTYIEARAPLLDRAGRYLGYLGIDYDVGLYQSQINSLRLAAVASLAVAVALGAGIGAGAYRMRSQSNQYLNQARAAQAAEHRQREVAEQASAAKSELLAIASHDLKNPLSAIAGMSGLLLQMKRSAANPAAVRDDIETLEAIHASARHMSEIVRGILVNEGVEQGGLPFNPTATDVVGLCREILKFNAPAAAKKRVTLQAELPATLPAVVDAKLLREALDNYVSNAIKYAPKNRATTVVLSAGGTDAGLEIAVRDEGPGLTADDRAQAFGKFKKLSARPTGGETSTGLGLSIVKSIAELHGGSVGCESEPGKGARFWLKLPRASR